MDAARLSTIARRWWWLILIGTLMATAAFGFAERIRDRDDSAAFDASAALFVSLYNAQAAPEEVAARTGGESWTIDRLLSSYVAIIEGHAVAQTAADSLSIDVPASELRRSVEARALPDSQLIRVTATAATPEDAETLRDAVVRAFVSVRATAGLPGNAYTYELTPPALRGEEKSGMGTLAVVIVAAMLAAATIILAFEYLSDAVRDVQEAEALTGLPVLAALPAWRARGRIAIDIDPRDRASRHAAERYRLLRSSLNRAPARPSIVAVTGTLEGAGATTTAANYAAVLARSGRRTLLVDANLRDPAIGGMFGRTPSNGLSFALRDGAFADLVTRTDTENLAVVHAGPTSPDAAELVESQRFAALIDDIRARFDAVVIDCPPVLTATETLTLAALADATVVVLRADRTARSEAVAAIEMLRRTGAHVAGIVLNADPAAGPALFTRSRPAITQPEPAESRAL